MAGCVALISVILIQRTAQDGGGLTGGGSTMGGLFTARGSANNGEYLAAPSSLAQ